MSEKRSDYKPVVDVDKYNEGKILLKRCNDSVKRFYETVDGK